MVTPGGPPLGGRYELLGLLATGGMGQVWRGRDVVLGRPVAVKVLRSEYTGDPTFLARFRAEAQHAALLAHRNIAAVFDYGEAPAATGEHLAYLVMELVDGESLAAVLSREGRLDVQRTLDVLRQIAAGLAAAHAAGVVHRDVKPGNLLVGTDGVVRITDFGVAWSASDVPLTQTGQVVGTAQYLSPEQAEGGRGGPASDVYALGLIGYECLTGHRAFDGGTPVQIALRQIREEPPPLPDDVPGPVRALVARALCKDPAERFPHGAAFRDAVDDVLAGRPVPPPPAPTRRFATGARPGRRARALAPVGALLAGAVLAGAGIGVSALRSAPEPLGSAVAEAAPATGVVLRSADHVGRPVDDVEADLAALGLRVARLPVVTAEAPAGTVLALDPVGALQPGDLVTVSFAVAPAPAAASSAAPPVSDPAAPPPAAPVEADPVEAAAPAPPPVPRDDRPVRGNGNGNAKGNGNGNAKGNGNGNAGGNGNGNGNGRGG